jgi:predicted Zn-dependent peptidase
MDHLDVPTTEFQDFNKKIYIPNNAVLVVAGDAAQTKEWIQINTGAIKRNCY